VLGFIRLRRTLYEYRHTFTPGLPEIYPPQAENTAGMRFIRKINPLLSALTSLAGLAAAGTAAQLSIQHRL